jgi:hypothetical protein
MSVPTDLSLVMGTASSDRGQEETSLCQICDNEVSREARETLSPRVLMVEPRGIEPLTFALRMQKLSFSKCLAGNTKDSVTY